MASPCDGARRPKSRYARQRERQFILAPALRGSIFHLVMRMLKSPVPEDEQNAIARWCVPLAPTVLGCTGRLGGRQPGEAIKIKASKKVAFRAVKELKLAV